MPSKLTQLKEIFFPRKDAQLNQTYEAVNGWFGDFGQEPYPYMTYPIVAQEAFERNIVAYKGVMAITKAIGGLTWCLKDTKTDLEIDDPTHPLLKLLESPNPMQGKAAFFQHVMASKILDGNCFIEMNGPGIGQYVPSTRSPPRELWVNRPDWVQVIPGQNRLPAQYIYHPGGAQGGVSRTFPVNQVTGACPLLHIQSFSPLYEDTILRGLSPLRSAIMQILTHNEGNRWNKALLQNGARPSLAFTLANGGRDGLSDLTPAQLEQIKSEIRNNYASSKNAGKPMVLAGGLQVENLSMNPKDADYINLKNSVARDILTALGVPPQVLGIPGDNTYSNLQEARLSFYEDTVLPEARSIRDELNRWLVPLFGPNLKLDIDEDDISALSSRRSEKIAAISNSAFLTINEKRLAMGYEPIADGDVILVPTLNTTLSAVVQLAENPITPGAAPAAGPDAPPADEEDIPDAETDEGDSEE